MPESSVKPAGAKSYSCHVLRSRGSCAPTFDSWGDSEAEAISKCLSAAQAARARVTRVVVREFTADGQGFMMSNLLFGGRTLTAKEAQKRAMATSA